MSNLTKDKEYDYSFAHNPSAREAEAGGLWVLGQPEIRNQFPPNTKQINEKSMLAFLCLPKCATLQSEKRIRQHPWKLVLLLKAVVLQG